MNAPRKKKHLTKYMIGQSVYLTAVYFTQNNLYTFAAACAFGFLFSFIPVIMMVLTVLVRILHASPAFINAIVSFASKYKIMFDVRTFIDSLLSYRSFGWFSLVLTVFIIWMARQFFALIMQGMNRIFHYKAPVRPLLNQVLILAGELILVVFGAVIISTVFTVRQMLASPSFAQFRSTFPLLFGIGSKALLTITIYSLIFMFVALSYRFAAGTKPKTKVCIICAAICTVLFYFVSLFMDLFFNPANYNFIYGVLSNVMVLLLEVSIFFTLYFTCAQFIYVLQFFDSLLLGELYLLPERNDTSLLSIIKRMLFIKPSSLMTKDSTISCKAGTVIFAKDDLTDDSYYVLDGTVVVMRNGSFTYYDKGSFFGEQSCILSNPRAGEAKAQTDCTLIKVSAESFRALIENDSRAAEKAMTQVSDYVAKVYGRTTDFLV